MIEAVIGLGSNLGDRLDQLREAARRIGLSATIERASAVYETEPVGGPPQPAYLNAALLVCYAGTALALLDLLQALESAAGRVRDETHERWGARPLDLDLLYIEGLAIESERLTVPHPRLVDRAFALRPLVDVLPNAVDPSTRVSYARLAATNRQPIVRTAHALVIAAPS